MSDQTVGFDQEVSVHVRMADALLSTLRTLNTGDDGSPEGLAYALDNTVEHAAGTDDRLLPFALVREALMYPLTVLCHGNRARAYEVYLRAMNDEGSVSRHLDETSTAEGHR